MTRLQADPDYIGVSNDRSSTELRKFFAYTESTNDLIVLDVQAYKTDAKFRKMTVFEIHVSLGDTVSF